MKSFTKFIPIKHLLIIINAIYDDRILALSNKAMIN